MYPAQHKDAVNGLLGRGEMSSTQEEKAMKKQQKLAYGMELQQQARLQEERKQAERNERLGLAGNSPGRGNNGPPANFGPPPPQQMQSPMMGGYGGAGMPPPYNPPSPPPNPYAAPPANNPPPWASPPSNAGPPAPPWGGASPASPGGYGMQPPSPPPYQAPGGYGMPPGPPQYPEQGPPSPPPGHAGINVYPNHMVQQSPPPMPAPYNQSPPRGAPAPFAQYGMGQPGQQDHSRSPPRPAPRGGGLAGMHAGGAPGMDQKSEAQMKKEQYRMELEQQIAAKKAEEQRRREASLQEARKAQGLADVMGGKPPQGGGGAPFRDPSGHIVADFNEIHRMQQQREQGGAYGGMGGFPPQNMMGGGMGQPPAWQQQQMGGPPAMMGGMGMGGMNQQPYGQQMGGPPQMMGGGMGMNQGMGGMGMGGDMGMGNQGMGMNQGMGAMGQPGPPPPAIGNVPLGKFRSGNPYATPYEMDTKQQQRMELQEALERQIAEKKYKKDMEKQREQEELMKEEQRLRTDQEKLKEAYEAERNGGKGKGNFKTKEEAVADAWQKAKEEAEEAKRKQWEGRRGTRSSMPPPDTGGPPMPTLVEEGTQPMQAPTQVMHMPTLPPPPPRPTTQQLSEQVKRLAQSELDKMKAELDAQTASLKSILDEQNQQLKASKEHGALLEEQAESANAQVNKMRVDMIRNSMAVPESMMRILSDYEPAPRREAPPSLLDIGLDLPPPAAALRRSLPPNPAFDMGPLIPEVHNPQTMDHGMQRAFMRTPGRSNSRPPTQGMRQVNPLEASLAAESMFIYPNGRELPKHSHPTNNAMSQQAAAAKDLPFRSLVLSEGLKGGAGEGAQQPQHASSSFPRQPANVEVPDGHLAQAADSLSPKLDLKDMVSKDGHRVYGGGNSMESLNQAPLPPGTADAMEKARRELQAGAYATASAAASANTPADMEHLMQQNKDKLNMLRELAALGETGSVDRVDSFLKRFSHTHASLPERMHTPVLRVNTPMMPKAVSTTGYHAMQATAANGGAPYQSYNSDPSQQAPPVPSYDPSAPNEPYDPNNQTGDSGVGQQGGGEAGGVASPCSSRGGRRGGHGLAPHASSLAEGENSTVSVPPGSPGVPPAGIRKRGNQKMNDILFTDNNLPARASVDDPDATSQPTTPLLGDYLDPEGRNQMLPGPGAAPLTRVPSAGRRAPSAGKPPPSSSSHTAGHAGQGAHTQQGAGDALDAELGRMAHALPPRSASNSRPGSGREASIMATRSRRPSWGAGAEGGSNAQDLEWQVLGGAGGSHSRRVSGSGAGGALAGMAIPGLPPRTGSFTGSRRGSTAGSNKAAAAVS